MPEVVPLELIVLPTTLAADESSGALATKLTFERVIVWSDGHREIEGVTSKQLPAPEKINVTEPPKLSEE